MFLWDSEGSLSTKTPNKFDTLGWWFPRMTKDTVVRDRSEVVTWQVPPEPLSSLILDLEPPELLGFEWLLLTFVRVGSCLETSREHELSPLTMGTWGLRDLLSRGICGLRDLLFLLAGGLRDLDTVLGKASKKKKKI